MPNLTGPRFPTIRCWPYRIEYFQRPDMMAYEMRVSLDTRRHGGRSETLHVRRIIGDAELVQREIIPVLRAAVEASIMELTRAHIAEHLRIE